MHLLALSISTMSCRMVFSLFQMDVVVVVGVVLFQLNWIENKNCSNYTACVVSNATTKRKKREEEKIEKNDARKHIIVIVSYELDWLTEGRKNTK